MPEPSRIQQINAHGDIISAYPTKTYNFALTTTSPVTIHTPAASKIFLVYSFWYANVTATSLQIKIDSGTTLISTINLLNVITATEFFRNGGVPILIGRAIGEALTLELSATGDVQGGLTLGEGKVRGS